MKLHRFFSVIVTLALLLSALPAQRVGAVSPDIVISQVYGGGGNTGAPFAYDFIELYNRGTTAVSLDGWSLQYASATGTGNFGANSGQLTELSGTIAPGRYWLVQESGGSVGSALPTPNQTDTTPINMSGTAGKVALVNTTASLGCNGGSTPCSSAQLAKIIDLVGYGNANFFEGAAVPTLSNTTAALRNGNGATDTDNNTNDFTVGAPNPRNTPPPDAAPAVASTYPADGASNVPYDTNVAVTFTEAVDVSGAWYLLSCSLSGVHAAVVSGGPTVFTVNPNTDFISGDNCTFVVYGNQVSDQDSNDPPDTMIANFTVGFSTVNACTLSYTPIYDIQGSGPTAAITGTVTTQGVVVGDFEGSASQQGFYLQDIDGDDDPTTSDGIFVFTGANNFVSVGQVVRVTGYARERFNQTTLNGSNSNSAAVPAANIIQCGTDSVAPVDVTLPFADANIPEQYEGMYVRFPQSLVIAEYFNYDRFGEIVLAQPLPGESRPFTGTAVDEPGTNANARTAANALSRITLDDVNSAQNPAVLRHPNGQPFSLTNLFRGGDLVANAIGVLGYDFNLYRILPTEPADYTAANPRPASPESIGGTIRVAAMNTLNFFVTADYPSGVLDNKCGPLNNVECRGWDSDQPLEFTRQRDKLLQALSGLNADIIGLNELENSTGVEPLASITSGMPGYAYIATGTIGTDAIKVGLIYRPAVVTPVGDFKLLTSMVDPRFVDTRSRPSLAQTFEVNATGARFTVVVNHLKSKSDSGLAATAPPSVCKDTDPSNDIPDCDQGDGQGYWNYTRAQAAQALVDWLATDPTGSDDPDFIILGDLNSYAKEDPIDAIKAGADDIANTADDFTNLIAQFQGAFAYSYTFDGQAGYLDHALANASLFPQITGAADWHINSDEPDVLDYDTSFKPAAQDALYEVNAYRTSDHDPVVVGLNPNAPPTVNAGGPYSVNEGASVALTATGSDPNGDSLTYAWDLDNNGSFETSGQSVVFDAATSIAPATFTVKVKATDPLGLFAVAETTVSVLYNFTGFFQPVDNLPTLNTVKAGQAIPLKFSLDGDHGLNIFAAEYPKVELTTCSSSAADAIETTSTAGNSSLSYDAIADQYVYTWKTDKTWAGKCGQLVVVLNDGTTHTALFQFTR